MNFIRQESQQQARFHPSCHNHACLPIHKCSSFSALEGFPRRSFSVMYFPPTLLQVLSCLIVWWPFVLLIKSAVWNNLQVFHTLTETINTFHRCFKLKLYYALHVLCASCATWNAELPVSTPFLWHPLPPPPRTMVRSPTPQDLEQNTYTHSKLVSFQDKQNRATPSMLHHTSQALHLNHHFIHKANDKFQSWK